MDKNSNILICGLHKIVNKAFLRRFRRDGFEKLKDANDISLDLTSQIEVVDYFKIHKPSVVIYTGSVSGGISANMKYPAEFIYKNIISATNIIHSAKIVDADKLLFLASSCIYPRESLQPIKEEYIFNGPLEKTCEPYAVSRIAGLETCYAYNQQYNRNFIVAIPATIYGPEDDFDLESAHVISALMGKFHNSKQRGQKSVKVWGSGTPKREFIFVDDLVGAGIFLLDRYSANSHINVGSSRDYSISELAELIAETVEFKGDIMYDRTSPDGVRQKLLDSSKLNSLCWSPEISLKEGIRITYEWFKRYK
jgi:GDP-L-fucose synthase